MADMVRATNPKLQFWDSNGKPANGYRLFIYKSGTTATKAVTYTSVDGGTPNTNPIVLNSRGECDVWLAPDAVVRMELHMPGTDDPPTNSTSVWTGTSGSVPDKIVGFGTAYQSAWLPQTARAIISSWSSTNRTLNLTAVGNLTAIGFSVGRRVAVTMGPTAAPLETYYGSIRTVAVHYPGTTSATGLDGTVLTSSTGVTGFSLTMDTNAIDALVTTQPVASFALGFVDPGKNPIPLPVIPTDGPAPGVTFTAMATHIVNTRSPVIEPGAKVTGTIYQRRTTDSSIVTIWADLVVDFTFEIDTDMLYTLNLRFFCKKALKFF